MFRMRIQHEGRNGSLPSGQLSDRDRDPKKAPTRTAYLHRGYLRNRKEPLSIFDTWSVRRMLLLEDTEDRRNCQAVRTSQREPGHVGTFVASLAIFR